MYSHRHDEFVINVRIIMERGKFLTFSECIKERDNKKCMKTRHVQFRFKLFACVASYFTLKRYFETVGNVLEVKFIKSK